MAATNPDIAWAKDAFRARGERYTTYADYVAGAQPLHFATPKFDSAFGKTFEEFAYNRCSNVVDAMADRMQLSGFDSKDAGIAKDAKEIWDGNQMDDREGQIYREMFTMGDAYVYVEVDPDDGDVVMWPQSARNVRVQYDPERPGKIALAAKHWTDTARKRRRLNLYYPNRIEKYISRANEVVSTDGTTTSISTGDFSAYEPFTDEGNNGVVELAVNDTVPIFHFANNAPVNGYGISELHDIIPIQDALNKSLMDLLVAMEFAAFPQRYMVNIDTDAEGAEEAIQRFQAGIDRILDLYSGADGQTPLLGEFSAANIKQYADIVELFDTLVSRVAKVPVHYLQMTGDFPSGTALRLAETPFTAKMSDRHKSGRTTWSDAMRYGVRLKRGGVDVKRGIIQPVYVPAAPLSEEEQLALMLDKKTLGIPLEVILEESGMEPGKVARIIQLVKEQRDETARQFSRGVVPAGDRAA